ncbi:hypothetical protein ACFQ1M_11570 [Sungkyunkwania multivorans]|uniref:Uncharacterized protein n=1 Tax=Sungkyunkwania multivorans TaxID=1173618 RepID=A0ABW3D047_9FLAO
MDIFVEEKRKMILIQQRWQYTWLNDPATTSWTYKEKKDFHHRADTLIWGQWSNKYVVSVSGSSSFAKTYKHQDFTLNFDIKWELSKPHWSVEVTKIPKGKFKTSSVGWSNRKISLDTEDLAVVKRINGGTTYKQYPVSHEFGHATGNSKYAYTGGHGDEYRSTSAYFSDKKSIMNIGNELRKRHIDFVLKELNKMIPNTSFSYVSHR